MEAPLRDLPSHAHLRHGGPAAAAGESRLRHASVVVLRLRVFVVDLVDSVAAGSGAGVPDRSGLVRRRRRGPGGAAAPVAAHGGAADAAGHGGGGAEAGGGECECGYEGCEAERAVEGG